MKNLFVFLLIAVVAVEYGYGQAATRRSTTRRSTTRAVRQLPSGPNRQQGNTRTPLPTPNRVPTTRNSGGQTTTRRQQTQRPGQTTQRSTVPRNPNAPQAPSRTPPSGTTTINRVPPTTTTTRTSSRPNNPGTPPQPTATTIQTITSPNGNRRTTIQPRVGIEGHPDPRCPLVQDNRNPVLLPHANNCERFWKCDHGLAYEFRCPAGQHWNVARNYCDFPNLANCGNNNWNNGNVNNNWNTPPRNPWDNNNNGNQWNNGNNVQTLPDFVHPILIPVAPRQ